MNSNHMMFISIAYSEHKNSGQIVGSGGGVDIG